MGDESTDTNKVLDQVKGRFVVTDVILDEAKEEFSALPLPAGQERLQTETCPRSRSYT
jgi:hypothetical protein